MALITFRRHSKYFLQRRFTTRPIGIRNSTPFLYQVGRWNSDKKNPPPLSASVRYSARFLGHRNPTTLPCTRNAEPMSFFSIKLPPDTLRWIFDFLFWISMKHRVPEYDGHILTSINYLRDRTFSRFLTSHWACTFAPRWLRLFPGNVKLILSQGFSCLASLIHRVVYFRIQRKQYWSLNLREYRCFQASFQLAVYLVKATLRIIRLNWKEM